MLKTSVAIHYGFQNITLEYTIIMGNICTGIKWNEVNIYKFFNKS